jgi:phage shock protein C
MIGEREFRVDRRNGKLAGVCAGVADYTGIDVTLVRVALVVGTIAGGFPWTLVAYGLVAWFARPKRRGLAEAEALGSGRVSVAEMREPVRDIDRRLAEIDSYVASSSSRLEREFEELR